MTAPLWTLAAMLVFVIGFAVWVSVVDVKRSRLMTAASNSEARKRRLAIVPDALVLIHDFEAAVLAERDLLRPFDRARRENAVNALLEAMGKSPLYGGRS